MVASLDFFIAKNGDESFSWLETSDTYEMGAADEDAEEFLKTVDCWVMGSRTYETALKLGWPYGDIPTFVLTHRDLPSDRENVRFCSGDLETIVDKQLKPSHRNIWVVGGAHVARDFIKLNLADDIRITIAPILLGDGVQFVDHIGKEQALHLKDVVGRKNGFVELWYEIRGDMGRPVCSTP